MAHRTDILSSVIHFSSHKECPLHNPAVLFPSLSSVPSLPGCTHDRSYNSWSDGAFAPPRFTSAFFPTLIHLQFFSHLLFSQFPIYLISKLLLLLLLLSFLFVLSLSLSFAHFSLLSLLSIDFFLIFFLPTPPLCLPLPSLFDSISLILFSFYFPPTICIPSPECGCARLRGP